VQSDFLIIGGGIAGLSAAARLARHGRVTVVEAEAALGVHSSGRSATFSHFGIGNSLIRALTARSRDFFIRCDPPLARRATSLLIATEEMQPHLAETERQMALLAPRLRRCGPEDMQRLFPPLRVGTGAAVEGVADPDGLRLDSDAMLQLFARMVRDQGGTVAMGRRINRIERNGGLWRVNSEDHGTWQAPILVNAAGAWADRIAIMSGVEPVGLTPLRRTIIVVDGPPDADVRSWAFVKSAADHFYILPESGRLMASPVDEIPTDPCDAQPEEYDIALAAARVEQYTWLPVHRIAHRWAGLRTFAPDRDPVVGFDPEAEGFFWLAGQGGAGLQTAPALAEVVEALAREREIPADLAEMVSEASLSPSRLR